MDKVGGLCIKVLNGGSITIGDDIIVQIRNAGRRRTMVIIKAPKELKIERHDAERDTDKDKSSGEAALV